MVNYKGISLVGEAVVHGLVLGGLLQRILNRFDSKKEEIQFCDKHPSIQIAKELHRGEGYDHKEKGHYAVPYVDIINYMIVVSYCPECDERSLTRVDIYMDFGGNYFHKNTFMCDLTGVEKYARMSFEDCDIAYAYNMEEDVLTVKVATDAQGREMDWRRKRFERLLLNVNKTIASPETSTRREIVFVSKEQMGERNV